MASSSAESASGFARSSSSRSTKSGFAALEVVGADHHRQGGKAADAAFQLLQRDRGGRALRQELAEVGAQIAVEAHREGEGAGEHHGPERHDQPGAQDGERGEALPQPVTSPPGWNGLHAVQDGPCYPAPWRAATIEMASRSSKSPASPTSFSMVSAGCRRIACV